MVQTQSNRPFINPTQRRWSVDDYHRMITAGILTSGDYVELLEGCIIEMSPQEPPYASMTSSIGNDLVILLADQAWVRQQLPLTIAPQSEPQPDIAVVRMDPNRYRDRHPTPGEVYLLIEIADSTLEYDCDRKARLYARAGIPEYWVVDVDHQQILVFRDPRGNVYQLEQGVRVGGAIAPLAFPRLVIEVAKLLG